MYRLRDHLGCFKMLDNQTAQGLNLIKNCLISILNFSHDHSTDITSLNMSTKADPSRQKMLKEQGFIKLLAELLDNCFPTKESLSQLKLLQSNGLEDQSKDKTKLISRKTIWQEFQSSYLVDTGRPGNTSPTIATSDVM